jgi:hypothetical protein
LAVGTDDQILTADSSAPSGVSWQDAPAGGGGGGADTGAATLPSDYTLKAMSFNPEVPGANYALDLGYLLGAKVWCREAFTIGKVWYYKNGNAATTSNYNGIGIYSSAGTLLGKTADLGSSWTSDANDTVYSKTVTAEAGQSLAISADGFVIVVFLCNAGTAVTMTRVNVFGMLNFGLTGLGLRASASTANGNTGLPSTITGGSRQSQNGLIWTGLST